MSEKLVWYLPIKTVSEANCSEHWTRKSKRHRQQQFLVKQLFVKEFNKIPIPCQIKLVRLSPRALDSDNLVLAFKWIRDEISENIFFEKRSYYVNKRGKIVPIKGREDSNPLVKWEYDQEKNPVLGIRIEIQAAAQETTNSKELLTG